MTKQIKDKESAENAVRAEKREVETRLEEQNKLKQENERQVRLTNHVTRMNRIGLVKSPG